MRLETFYSCWISNANLDNSGQRNRPARRDSEAKRVKAGLYILAMREQPKSLTDICSVTTEYAEEARINDDNKHGRDAGCTVGWMGLYIIHIPQEHRETTFRLGLGVLRDR